MSETVSAGEALIAQWRTVNHLSDQAGAYQHCADQLERVLAAALPASPPAAPTPCTDCGYVPGSEVHPSVVTNKPGCPVAAPCAILGCQFAAPTAQGWQPPEKKEPEGVSRVKRE